MMLSLKMTIASLFAVAAISSSRRWIHLFWKALNTLCSTRNPYSPRSCSVFISNAFAARTFSGLTMVACASGSKSNVQQVGGDERAARRAVDMIGFIESLLEIGGCRLRRVAHLLR